MDLLKSVGAAGTSAVITVTGIHPIDVVKTRLQVSGDGVTGGRNYKALGISGTCKVIAAEEGVAAFWKGIGAAWLREASYTSLRLGLYSPIKVAMGVTNDSNFFWKFSAGSLAGALGSIVGNPFDVLKTRMMASDAVKSPTLAEASSALYKQQGMAGFYRGIDANVMRAMVLNGTKMSCYDQINDLIKKSGAVPKGLPTQFCAAFGAGFFMATTVAPFDMVRTRLMNQPPDVKLYSGFADCLMKIIAKDGFGGLYAGFIPIWSRFAPTTCLQLVIFEQLKPVFGV
mmetsp:Transcript_16811/g.37309  ORF Transcript_16811/g.37309 Transcript_16811/m.37309 type:complete len:285 (+) Transcript_16811:90-944(+)